VLQWNNKTYFQASDSVFNKVFDKAGTTFINQDKSAPAVERNSWNLIKGYGHLYMLFCQLQKMRAKALIHKIDTLEHK